MTEYSVAAGPDSTAHERVVDVIALVTSAGGVEALSQVLRALPVDFPAAVVVTQHLGGPASQLLRILGRRTDIPVTWASDGETVKPGTVTVCPPRSLLEVLPDGSCAVRPSSGAVDRPLDALLASVGDSFGSAALGVVLTGMGNDGAAGAASLRATGALVIAQSEETSEHPAMPAAAIAGGGVDLVLPLYEIGPALVAAALGRRVPLGPSEEEAIRAIFGVDGEVAATVRSIDWTRHPLGPVSGWPPVLRSLLHICAHYPTPHAVLWGAQLHHFYNDAAIAFHAEHHPGIFARPLRETYPEIKELLDALLGEVLEGRTVQVHDGLSTLLYEGALRDRWLDYTYSPVPDDDGKVIGVQIAWADRTDAVLGERRLLVLSRLSAIRTAVGRGEAARSALDVFAQSEDILFALAYLVGADGARATLVHSVGLADGGQMSPQQIRLVRSAPWPLQQVLESHEQVVLADLGSRFPGHVAGPQRLTPETAVLHPIRDDDRVVGVLVLGVNPRLPFDDRYREFLTLAGETTSTKIADSHARERELRRLEQLAELDRTKTEFFSNVSHEFRTPLTLMLGPLEELLNDGRLSAAQTAELEMVSRNAQRLLRLVGTMLDFSQIEAGRLRARFAPVDLAERTRDIAAMFESAASRAGLTLTVDVDELPAPVWVDVEMWEKIVSNLLSNALKFTLAGEVTVTLRALPKHAELVVRDTGVGIPVEELPHIFKRFHRVRGARGRSDEGAGIGLALVDELVRRHHGRVRAISSPGRGAAFTVWVPLGRRPGVDAESPRPSATSAVAAAMAQEAMQWAGQPAQHVAIDVDDMDHSSLHGYAPGAHVLVADDNQDMRDYLARLLAPHWQADVARDGAEALAMARDHRPDLVLADVMMPGLDGFALLRELRRDPLLASVPVILVTARAGEESAIEGLLAGADDYIVKPFSARELVARVGGQLELARARQHAIELNAFRIRLSDALRELDDEREIQRTACRMVVEQLGADRARYVELDEKAQEFVTLVEYNASGMPAASGRYAMAAYAPLTDAIHAGRRLVIRDTQTDPAVASIRDALAELHIHAHLVVPLMRDGRSVSAFAVHQRVARDWTEEEVTLVEEIAGRAWAEVSRARAEAELRRVNAQMRDQLRSLTR